jgi:hypothetical protein
MAAGAILRAGKLKGRGAIRAAAAHNLRVIQAELGARSHIDVDRIGLNAHLAGPADPETVSKLADDRMNAAGIGALRKDAVRAIEFLVSLPVGAGVDEDAFFGSALRWLAERFGGVDNVLSADVHRDESAPHMHLLILPLVGGRMVGSDALGGPTKLRALQDGFYANVCEPYGLKRFPKRLSGDSKRAAVGQILMALERGHDPSLKSKLWPLIRDRIAADPGPFAEILGIEVRTTATPRRQRTMTEIFTSPGKGPKRETEVRNPIGFAAGPKAEPYAL